MRKILPLMMLVACGFEPAQEGPEEGVVIPRGEWTAARVVRDETTRIDLLLDETSVFCTGLGYGAQYFLKVSIPQLDALAHFDHRVEGTELPCAAVGECSADMNAEHILQQNPGVEPTDLRVVLTEQLRLDGDAQTCHHRLVEDVSAEVRGVPVSHHVEGEWEAAALSACLGG